MQNIRSYLLRACDEHYRSFMLPLIPSVDPERVIGVRTPVLRALAKELAGTHQAEQFMLTLPHDYFEEDNLHAFLIERSRSFGEALEQTERFLAHIDNWATCDQFNPKALTKKPDILLEHTVGWLCSQHTYTIRFGIETLMRHFLDERFEPEYLMLAAVRSDEYYVNMMIAWYFATALAKQYEHTIVWIENRLLPEWVHNRTIQKAIESRRISDESKAYLRTLKIKGD